MSDPRPAPRIGADYFPEHWPEERWAEDARLMVEAGLTVARVGEFTWSKIQPMRGAWEWGWLDRAVAVLADAGLKVILCTPSACPPPWMVTDDPTIIPTLATGERLEIGHRRHYSPHHAGYKQASVDMAERMAERYGQHPAVIGFQIDNELCGTFTDTGPLAKSAFQGWLAARHGSLATLDERMGLIFWGMQYNSWDQIPVPVGGPGHHPSMVLEFKRFDSEAWVEFCRVQAEVMRPHIGDRILTTNCYLHRWGIQIDWHRLVVDSKLDRFAFDNYSSSDSENAYYNDLARSLTDDYWILEQQCGLPQGQHLWPDDPERIPKLIRESVRRGADVLTYFRWRQCRFAQEQDHGAILDHDGIPGVIYDTVKASTAELTDNPLPAPPAATTGIVFSWDDGWALGTGANPIDYAELIRTKVHDACETAGLASRFCFDPADLAGLSTIVVAAKILHDPAWEQALADAVAAGARLVLLPLLFAKDQWNAWQTEYQTATIRQLQGARLVRRVPIKPEHSMPGANGEAISWFAELWHPEAEVSISRTFGEGPLADQPLVFTTSHAAGSVTTVAGYLDQASLADVLKG